MANVLILVSLAAVAIILFAGIAVMAIGGETAKHWSNRLMRYRVVAQAVAILIIILAIYAGRH